MPGTILRSMTLSAAILLIGCGGINRTEIIKHPDTPMLIAEGRGNLRVYVWDGEKLIEYGWVQASELKGWTVDKFDWDSVK